jgi:biopolymer transport protein ExbB
MKKFIAILAVMGVMTFGLSQSMMAQDSTATATDSTASEKVEEAAPAAAPVAAGEESFHKSLKTKYIEGDAGFMSLVAIALVLGLAFCIERIIYLSLAEVNTKKLMKDIEAKLANKDIEGAKQVAKNTRGPVASNCYQGLMHVDEGLATVDRTVTAYGDVQAGYQEQNCS